MKSTEVIPAIKTDHSSIYLELVSIDNGLSGPGYWKMNCSLLEDDAYSDEISKMIPLWLEEG